MHIQNYSRSNPDFTNTCVLANGCPGAGGVALLTVALAEGPLQEVPRGRAVGALVADLPGSVCSPAGPSAFREAICHFTLLVPLALCLILTLHALLTLPAPWRGMMSQHRVWPASSRWLGVK